MELNEIPTPRVDKAEYEVRLGNHKRKVVRPELARDLEQKLTFAREGLVKARGFVEAVCNRTMGPEYRSGTLEDIDKALKLTAPKP